LALPASANSGPTTSSTLALRFADEERLLIAFGPAGLRSNSFVEALCILGEHRDELAHPAA
jgi:hypothetical protein